VLHERDGVRPVLRLGEGPRPGVPLHAHVDLLILEAHVRPLQRVEFPGAHRGEAGHLEIGGERGRRERAGVLNERPHLLLAGRLAVAVALGASEAEERVGDPTRAEFSDRDSATAAGEARAGFLALGLRLAFGVEGAWAAEDVPHAEVPSCGGVVDLGSPSAAREF
jgi:hypothetical protein